MTPQTHHQLTSLAGILLGLGAVGITLVNAAWFESLGVHFGLAVFGAFLTPLLLFRNLVAPRIPAECPSCHGPSYLRGFKRYSCSRCGHVTDVSPWGASGRIGGRIREAADRDTRGKG